MKYTVTDGKLVLTIQEADGWIAVTSPFEPGLNTQAKSVAEAFIMARDALKELRLARREQFRLSQVAEKRSRRRAS